MKRLKSKLIVFLIMMLCACGAFWFWPPTVSGSSGDYRTARAEKCEFKQAVRRYGTLKPISEVHIFSQLSGSILSMAEQGKVVAKDEIVLQLEAAPFETEKADHEALMAQEEVEFKKTSQEGAKALNHAKEDVDSCNLLLELETGRLAELKKGAAVIDRVNAEVNLENNKTLLAAKKEEVDVYESLAAGGYESQAVLRQKRLELTEQRLKVTETDIALRKLDRLDPVKIAEQELKVKGAVKTRDSAIEQVKLLERNRVRDNEKHTLQMDRERKTHKDMLDNIAKCIVRAPGPGVVVHKRNRWYTFAPGRGVYDGVEVMSLPDFTRMKAVLAVDEGRISNVQVGLAATILPAGWTGAPFKGKVSKVAEKCRDEFEAFHDETTALSGAANRQVFDVEVEIEGVAPVLRPGLRAEVEIVLQKMENAIVVPRSALQRQDDSVSVRVDNGGAIERRKIKVLAENDLLAAVEGVKEGERVWVVSE